MPFLDTASQKAWIDKHDTFLFDCDGVLWLGKTVVPGVVNVLKNLRALGKKLVFCTNNSTLSRQEYLEKFAKFGIQADKDEIFGSSYAAAVYLSSVIMLPKDKKVFIIGMEGMQTELESEGIEWIGGQTIHLKMLSDAGEIKADPSIGAVLFGMDINISYTKYARAFTYLQNPGCKFLATNTDLTFPCNGANFPGCGAFLSVLTSSLGRDPIVVGKPHKPMMDAIIAKYPSKYVFDCRLHLDPSKTAMIGDRLDTDIAFGKFGGLSTLLVLTGVTQLAGLATDPIVPDYYIQSLGDLNYGLDLDALTLVSSHA